MNIINHPNRRPFKACVTSPGSPSRGIPCVSFRWATEFLRRSSGILATGRPAAAAFLFLLPAMSLHGAEEVNVSGRIVYADVDQSPEEAVKDNGERASIFDRGLAAGEPVGHVTVELWGSTSIVPVDSTVTDKDGNFTLRTTLVHPKPGTLRVKAKNDYANVKRSKLAPAITDNSISVDFGIKDEYDGGNVELGEVGIDDDLHIFTANLKSHPASRAFYVASSIHRDARHIEELSGRSLDMVWVRLGYVLTPAAWYDKFHLVGEETIHLPATDAAIIDHEYGHFIEDKIGAFGIVPDYLLEGGHSGCEEQGDCWAFFEGLASWYGAVNSRGFTTVSGVEFFGDPVDGADSNTYAWDTDAMIALGYSWWIEDPSQICDSTTRSGWSDPRTVEAVVAQTLWDLVDSSQDVVDVWASGVPEVAEIPIKDVIKVLMTKIPSNTPCSWANPYTHPATLEQFFEVYLDIHSAEGVWPDLYAACAVNGVAGLGVVKDTEGPEAVTLASSSHPAGEWRNTPEITLTITDGADDFSGSYYYFTRWDYSADTALSESNAGIGSQDFESKNRSHTINATLVEGDGQYCHAQTRDLAGHLGTTAHFGPVRIDMTKPEWVSWNFPESGKPHVIGQHVRFDWVTSDDLSGVKSVSITYSDPENGIDRVLSTTSNAAVGSCEFYLDPDYFVPTTTGYFTLLLSDHAGNGVTRNASTITIVSPFGGPVDLGLSLKDGRVVCGDIDGDGKDEIVISGERSTGARILQTMGPGPAVLQSLSPGVSGGDLFLADTDRDGDLDLIAAGDFGATGRQIQHYANDGTGRFTPLGPLPVTEMDGMVVRVVDLYGTGDPVLVWGGRAAAGSTTSELHSYHFRAGVVDVLTGIEFRGGDFEVGDINADGILDFVTLSNDIYGDGRLAWHLGDIDNGSLQWTTAIGTSDVVPQVGDVDLGNWDHDKDLDLFVMYRVDTPDGAEDRSQVWEWNGSTFLLAIEAGGFHAIAEGDGHIVEIYNDGLSDVFAMGRQLSGSLSGWYVSNDMIAKEDSGHPQPVRTNQRYRTDTAWGDFDGDGDLDAVVTGTTWLGTGSTVRYENLMDGYGHANRRPSAPRNLESHYNAARGGMVFSWEAPGSGTDETMESAFEYEIRVGTSSGDGDIVTWAHPAGRSQQVAAIQVGPRYERFVPLPAGSYDWNVRTVDNGWLRSRGSEIVLTGFSGWRADFYMHDEIAAGLADPASDSDRDGLATALEYYHGRNPLVPDAGRTFLVSYDSSARTIRLSWPRAIDAEAIAAVEMSENLAGRSWEEVPAEVLVVSETVDAGDPGLVNMLGVIQLDLLPPAKARFFRLRVNLPDLK